MLKNKKKLINLSIIILVIIFIILIIFKFISNKNAINVDNNKYIYSCSYNDNDGYKTTINRYEVTLDRYSLIKNIEHLTILDYDNEEIYKDVKNHFNVTDMKIEYKLDDENNDVTLINYLDKKRYIDLKYNEFKDKLDKNYKCEDLNLDVITYECSKTIEEDGYIVHNVYTITSDKDMNVSKINLKEWLKYKDLDIYNRDKNKYIDKESIKIYDKNKTITNTYDIPTFDKDGNKLIINIKDYVDDFDGTYVCKYKNN